MVNLICNKGFLLTSLLLLQTSVWAEKVPKKERWFEVEVILFTQNNDKSLLKETFPDNAQLPKQRRVIELLAPFLKPDIRSLKALLPECGQSYPKSLFEQSAQLPALFVEKSLDELAQIAQENLTTFSNNTITQSSNNGAQQAENYFGDDTDYNNTRHLPNTNTSTKLTTANLENISLELHDSDELTPQLDEETIALVNAAEKAFAPIKFPYLQSLYYQSTKLCRLPRTSIEQLKQADSNFNEFDFTLDKVPATIDAAENIYSDKPYLLSKSSLKLGNIVKQLKWSKEFKPLLHLGWRLAPKDRKFAVPVHIFAGDNLQADYQKRLQQYQQALTAEKQKEALLQQVLSVEPLSEEAQKQQARQSKIEEIVTTLNNFQKNTSEVIAEIAHSKPTTTEALLLPQPPQPPLQNWYLEGFFNVHLNHYLFITADFTILSKTLTEQAQERLNPDQSSVEPLKLIPFAQNRRVISKEIHYFDHPYFGMIVQIRRHKRPEPPVEDEPLAEVTSNPLAQ